MKRSLTIAIVSICSLFPASAKEDPKAADPFEEGMRQAFASYKKGDSEAVTAKLRELLKLMEEVGAEKVAELLPAKVAGWTGETLKRENAAALGGGVLRSRAYAAGERRIVLKVIKDSPVVAQLLPLLANEDLMRLSNRKTHRVSGEIALLEGEHKLQLVVDGRIYVELEGDKTTGETELVAFARKLDLKALAKLK